MSFALSFSFDKTTNRLLNPQEMTRLDPVAESMRKIEDLKTELVQLRELITQSSSTGVCVVYINRSS